MRGAKAGVSPHRRIPSCIYIQACFAKISIMAGYAENDTGRWGRPLSLVETRLRFYWGDKSRGCFCSPGILVRR